MPTRRLDNLCLPLDQLEAVLADACSDREYHNAVQPRLLLEDDFDSEEQTRRIQEARSRTSRRPSGATSRPR
jgi:hypothetical protein